MRTCGGGSVGYFIGCLTAEVVECWSKVRRKEKRREGSKRKAATVGRLRCEDGIAMASNAALHSLSRANSN